MTTATMEMRATNRCAHLSMAAVVALLSSSVHSLALFAWKFGTKKKDRELTHVTSEKLILAEKEK